MTRIIDWQAEIERREEAARANPLPSGLVLVDLTDVPPAALRLRQRRADPEPVYREAARLRADAKKAESLADMLANKDQWDASEKQRVRAKGLREQADKLEAEVTP